MTNNFSISDSVSKGFDLLSKRMGALVLFVFISFAIETLMQMALGKIAFSLGMFGPTLVGIITNLITAFFTLAFITKSLDYYDNNDTNLSIEAFFSSVDFKLFINYILTSILCGIVIAVPTFILIGIGVFAIYGGMDGISNFMSGGLNLTSALYFFFVFLVIINLSARVYFATFFIADRITESPIEALKMSLKASNGNVWKLFLLMIVLIMIAIAGVLLFLVGLLFAYPIILLASIHAYRSISRNINFDPSEEVTEV